MTDPQITLTTITVPTTLYQRTGAIAKRLKTTRRQIIRDALTERVENLEAKFKREEEEAATAKLRKLAEKTPRFKPRELGGPLTPLRDFSTKVRVEDLEDAPNSRLEAIYTDIAKQMLKAGDDSLAINHLALLCTKQVKRECPLARPPDRDILIALEQVLIRVRDEQASAEIDSRDYDDLVGALVQQAKKPSTPPIDLPPDPNTIK